MYTEMFIEEEMAAIGAQVAQFMYAQIKEYERWNDENVMNEN